MTGPSDFELVDLATPYALDAVSDSERAEIERRVLDAPAPVTAAFYDQVRAVRETMAVVSAVTAVEPPPALRGELLAAVSFRPNRGFRWRSAVLATAAAAVIGLGAVGVGLALRPAETPSIAAQVVAAPDVRTVSGQIPSGGTATVLFSRAKDAGVLVMNNVAPPEPGTVYQMWLLGEKGATSAGTMDAKAVAPSTTAVLPDLAKSKALAFTVEPGNGSTHPTGPIFAELPLTG